MEVKSYSHGRDSVLHLGSPGSDRGLWSPAAAALLIGVWDGEERLVGRSDLECWCLERTFSFVVGLWGRGISWSWSETECAWAQSDIYSFIQHAISYTVWAWLYMEFVRLSCIKELNVLKEKLISSVHLKQSSYNRSIVFNSDMLQ